MESNTTDQFPVNDCLTDILINIRALCMKWMDGCCVQCLQIWTVL